MLLYVCQPCLTFYSFCKVSFSARSFLNLSVCFVLTLTFQTAMILLLFLLFKKKRQEISWRLIAISAVLSNCGFMGVPLLEKLLPEHPEVLAYSSVFSLTMNMVGWSLGMYVISLDKKYVSPKKILVNPATLSLAAALPFYFLNLSTPAWFQDAVTLLGRMSAPLCMLIMGMRLATVKPINLLTDPKLYLSVVLNQIFYPLTVFALTCVLPIDGTLKITLVILSACPVASMVQNYAEILGKGQDKAANTVLLGTAASILTVPLICLIL